MRGGGIQIPQLAGHHLPARECNFNGVSLASDDGPTLNVGLVAL